MQSVHIKVTACNSIRRFALTEAKLGALRQQIVSLFDIKTDANWSIKYKDKRQLVTLTSDEDLESAIKLMGNRVLRVVVVEDGVDLAENADNQERKVRRHEKRDRKCYHDERDDLVEKQRDKRPVDPETRMGQKKKAKLEQRLVSLKAADTSNAQSQASKIEQKLAAIKSEIDSVSAPPVVDTQVTVAETLVVVPPTVHSTDAKILDTKMAKEAVNKFFSLHQDMKSQRKKIDSLAKVVQAMRVLSRLGAKASSPVTIDADQLAVAQTSLADMHTDLRSKKVELKQQKQLLKQLKKQGYADARLEKEMQRKKEKKDKKGAKKCEKEKKWKETEDQESREQAKAQWKAEKAKKRRKSCTEKRALKTQ
jgi:hypothetical protein